MRTKFIVAGAVLIFGSFLSGPGHGQSCGCADKKDLLNRLNLVEIAIQEYGFQIQGMKAKAKAVGSPVRFTEEGYKEILQPAVNEAMQLVRDDAAHQATGKTNSTDCGLDDISAATDCLREAMRKHEAVHQAACSAVKSSGFSGDYQNSMTLADFAQEEIYAYREERKYLLEMLTSLPQWCRPNDWFGFVVYQEIHTVNGEKTGAARGTGHKPGPGIVVSAGRKDTTTTSKQYIGTVFVENGKPASARAFAAWESLASSFETGRVYCTPKRPDEQFVATTGDKQATKGSAAGTATLGLRVDPATGTYSIYTKFFPVPTSGQRTYTTNNNACGNPPKTVPTALSGGRETASPYTIKGTIERSFPDYLMGSITEKPPLLQSSQTTATGSATITFEITARWMLRRLPLK
jgi:hypothetical protein